MSSINPIAFREGFSTKVNVSRNADLYDALQGSLNPHALEWKLKYSLDNIRSASEAGEDVSEQEQELREEYKMKLAKLPTANCVLEMHRSSIQDLCYIRERGSNTYELSLGMSWSVPADCEVTDTLDQDARLDGSADDKKHGDPDLLRKLHMSVLRPRAYVSVSGRYSGGFQVIPYALLSENRVKYDPPVEGDESAASIIITHRRPYDLRISEKMNEDASLLWASGSGATYSLYELQKDVLKSVKELLERDIKQEHPSFVNAIDPIRTTLYKQAERLMSNEDNLNAVKGRINYIVSNPGDDLKRPHHLDLSASLAISGEGELRCTWKFDQNYKFFAAKFYESESINLRALATGLDRETTVGTVSGIRDSQAEKQSETSARESTDVGKDSEEEVSTVADDSGSALDPKASASSEGHSKRNRMWKHSGSLVRNLLRSRSGSSPRKTGPAPI